MKRGQKFWLRITDGLMLNQLWRQFHTDARVGYRLYTQDVQWKPSADQSKREHLLRVLSQFGWAIIEKFSPARRILLLIALMLLFSNVEGAYDPGRWRLHILFPGALWGGLLLLALLVMEVADRVVMKRDLQIAKEIQSWLLPTAPPTIAGLEIAFMTRPANTVAGDYYDAFCRSPEGATQETFVLAIADVAGKSVPAALLMATFQASLKTLSKTPGPLATLVAGMNAYVCGNSQSGRRYITAVLGEYEPGSRTLEYVNCGQNPPIVRRRTGAIERLEAGGIPLGIMTPAFHEAGRVTLSPGDLLVFFTDGVTEAEDKSAQQYGEERLIGTLHRHSQANCAALLLLVQQDLDRFVGDTPQHDDITLMVVRAV